MSILVMNNLGYQAQKWSSSAGIALNAGHEPASEHDRGENSKGQPVSRAERSGYIRSSLVNFSPLPPPPVLLPPLGVVRGLCVAASWTERHVFFKSRYSIRQRTNSNKQYIFINKLGKIVKGVVKLREAKASTLRRVLLAMIKELLLLLPPRALMREGAGETFGGYFLY